MLIQASNILNIVQSMDADVLDTGRHTKHRKLMRSQKAFKFVSK